MRRRPSAETGLIPYSDSAIIPGGHNGIRLSKAPEQRVIPAGVVEVQSQDCFVILAREAPGGQVAEGAIPVLAPSSGSGRALG